QFLHTLCRREGRRKNHQSDSHFESSGSANTVSTLPPRDSNSGKNPPMPPASDPQPLGFAMNWRPFTEYVTDDPRFPAPVWKLHSFCPVRASSAKKNPSGSPEKTRSPAVVSNDAINQYLY